MTGASRGPKSGGNPPKSSIANPPCMIDLTSEAESNLTAAMQTREVNASELRLRQTMPELAARLDDLEARVMARIDSLGEQLLREMADMARNLADLTSGRATINISAQIPGMNVEFSGRDAQDADMGESQNPHNPTPHLPISITQPISTQGATSIPPSGQNESGPSGSNPKIYRMNRSIFKVPDLWREWRSGLGGETPVEVLEHRYGRRWCPNAAERKFFLRRKVLVDAIVKRAKLTTPEGQAPSEDCMRAAAEWLEVKRKTLNKSMNGYPGTCRLSQRIDVLLPSQFEFLKISVIYNNFW